MAQPDFVPRPAAEVVRTYSSPPRDPEGWLADRPGDFSTSGRQPSGALLGSQGPDQGYALSLVPLFDGRLTLTEGEHFADVAAGCVAVALKRASLFGRAPVVHDLTVAFTVFGFLDETPDPELVARRRPYFAEAAHPHHYLERRRVADLVAPEVLAGMPADVAARHRQDWRGLLAAP